MEGAIVVVVILLGLWMWRRRAGRRSMAAHERVASVLDPEAPPGRYPRPGRGMHRLDAAGGADIVRVCSSCTRMTPTTAGAVGPARWLLVDVCAACAKSIARASDE